MTLKTTIILRCKGPLKQKLVDVALEMGLSPSSIARNNLALALFSEEKEEQTRLEKVIELAKKERSALFVRDRGKDNGQKTKEAS